MTVLLQILIIGLVATLVADAWGLARKPLLGVPPPDYRPVGRWILRMASGRFASAGETAAGWAVHYLIGVLFAVAMVLAAGRDWLATPTILPALIFGVGTVAAPFLLLQPAMGLGFAGSRTARPWATRLQSLATHAAFGLGLYAGARVAALVSAFSAS